MNNIYQKLSNVLIKMRLCFKEIIFIFSFWLSFITLTLVNTFSIEVHSLLYNFSCTFILPRLAYLLSLDNDTTAIIFHAFL